MCIAFLVAAIEGPKHWLLYNGFYRTHPLILQSKSLLYKGMDKAKPTLSAATLRIEESIYILKDARLT